jgi:hypothetical protein
MAEGGLVLANDVTQFGDVYDQAQPRRLTWHGHEFIDAARNDTTWNRTKAAIGSAPLTAWMQILTEAVLGMAKHG